MAAGTFRAGGTAALAAAALVAGAGGASALPSGAASSGTAPAAPATFVALTDPDTGPSAVGVFSSTTGELLRRLTPEAPGGGPSDPLITRGGGAVVYAAGAGSCASEIHRVALDGRSAPEVLVPGRGGPVLQPALAPGGRRIAYVQASCDSGDTQLVVHRYRTDAAPVVLLRAGSAEGIHQPRWSADGRLAFRTTGEGSGLHAVRARAGSPVRSADAPAGCTWAAADWYTNAQGRQRLLASADCPDGGRWMVLNERLRTLRTLATFPDQSGAQAVSVDATGTQAVYQEHGASVPGAVWRWGFRSGGAPEQVAVGPSAPSWR